MTHHQHDREEEAARKEEQPTPGPRENTDEATKADAGMTGTPAESYSPEGMAEDEENEENEEA